jgi:hypothetical protein
MHHPSLFKSFFLGGFECSNHRRSDGRRLDLIAATGHDRWAAHDYAELYKRYQQLADQTPGVTFVGRLGTYKYYNMDQVVGQALALYKRIEEAELATQPQAVPEQLG